MTDKVLVANKNVTVVDTIESFYSSPVTGLGTRIKTFTASNDSPSSRSYKAYIFDSSGAVVQAVVPQTIVVKDRADYGASIVNHVIPSGGSLRMEASGTDGPNFYVTGVDL